jgi:hypothetical protein
MLTEEERQMTTELTVEELKTQLAELGPGWDYSEGAGAHQATRRGSVRYEQATSSLDTLLDVVKGAEGRISDAEQEQAELIRQQQGVREARERGEAERVINPPAGHGTGSEGPGTEGLRSAEHEPSGT